MTPRSKSRADRVAKLRDAQRALVEAKQLRDAAPMGSEAYRRAVYLVGRRWSKLRKLLAQSESEEPAVGGSSLSRE